MPDPIAIPPLMRPTAERPLAGLTVLVVEDSRYASEAMRLLCQIGGARLRRADSLAAAYRHLRVYRPDVLIVDLGLPDGPGEALIAELARLPTRPTVLLGTSGDGLLAPAAMAAGADGFLEKPVPGVAAFQEAILAHLPEQAHLAGPRHAAPGPVPSPDPIALRDDLALAEDILASDPDASARDYVSRFLAGVAKTARDRPLAEAAARLASGRARKPGAVAAEARAPAHGTPRAARDAAVSAAADGTAGREDEVGTVARLVRARLAAGDPLWTGLPRLTPPAQAGQALAVGSAGG